ncbi:M23 family metallopeptidase [Paenibacillus sp. DMB20]|uniref:M23 family metallopeptidase n=1 Tax=Paenibacillus sp. DMB20 TaxID=1642570 RepID=UPI0006280E85|nr:M23 family metallopeptidase [Paenibacillus sp. DMB20]KKO50889.1 peptidase M23 [Paenibacillus sp. DMB20]
MKNTSRQCRQSRDWIRRTAVAILVPATAACLWNGGYAEAGHTLRSEKAVSAPKPKEEDVFSTRKALYDRIQAVTQVPWYRLAAIDQYERTLTRVHPKDRKHPQREIGIFVPPTAWAGPLNPNPEDTYPPTIELYSGMGRDGDGDGLADPNNNVDLLYSMASKLKPFGHSRDDFGIGLWSYYQNSRAVQRVLQYAKLYETFGKLDLFDHAFPLPVRSDYSYRSTYGMGRSWGGYRIHEGTDLFARYGVPVRSTCYGVVELKGWNRYGGWRIGIRDLNNHYHYYAHLQGFEKGVRAGDVVTPGQTIGWVGSSGYGKPGTSGKFPPHLHYGIYRDTGLSEWSFDPYPLLKQWELQERKALRKGKKARR